MPPVPSARQIRPVAVGVGGTEGRQGANSPHYLGCSEARFAQPEGRRAGQRCQRCASTDRGYGNTPAHEVSSALVYVIGVDCGTSSRRPRNRMRHPVHGDHNWIGNGNPECSRHGRIDDEFIAFVNFLVRERSAEDIWYKVGCCPLI